MVSHAKFMYHTIKILISSVSHAKQVGLIINIVGLKKTVNRMSQKDNKNTPSLFGQVVDKISDSTSTVTELRVPIFCPVQKLSGNSITAREFKKSGGVRTIQTSWGRVEVRGRKLLTQVHRDLLDCIFTHATKVQPLETNEVQIIFSQTRILKEYSGDTKSKSYEKQTKWLRDKIKEIRDITINYVDTRGNSFDFNLISHLDYLEEYKAYSITLDKRYLKFYENELSINYKKELPKLLKVESALMRAMIRWFFTHKEESRFYLDTVLKALGFPVDSPKSLQTAKKELKEHVDLFRSFGIEYDPKNQYFYYGGNNSVGFIPSLFSEEGQKYIASNEKSLAIKDMIGQMVVIDGKKSVIQGFRYEKEGAFIHSVTIDLSGKDHSIRIENGDGLGKEEFETEVILYLQSLMGQSSEKL